MKNFEAKKTESLQLGQKPLLTPPDLMAAAKDIAGAMNIILADVLALYLKTKTFRWRMNKSHFCGYRMLLDEQSDRLFAMTDRIAECIRKLGGSTQRSGSDTGAKQCILYNDAEEVESENMLAELCEDNKTLAARLREIYSFCEEHINHRHHQFD